jgi:hypothetical protein
MKRRDLMLCQSVLCSGVQWCQAQSLALLCSGQTDGPNAPLTGRGCLQGGNVGRCFPSPLALVPADQTSRPAAQQPSSPAAQQAVLVLAHLPAALRVCARVCVCTCPNGRRRTQDGLSTGRCPSTKTSDPETALIWQPRPAALSRFIQTIPARHPLPPPPSDLLAGRSFFSSFDCAATAP